MGECPKCNEKSVRVKVYRGVRRVEYCTNKGCGYSLQLPNLKEGDR